MNNAEFNAALGKMVDLLKKEYDFETASVFIKQENCGIEMIYSDIDGNFIPLRDLIVFISESLKEAKDIRIKKSPDEFPLTYPTADERKIRYCGMVLLKFTGSSQGMILLEKKDVKNTKEFEEESFKTVAETMSLALENLLLHKKVLDLANKDQLTQVNNRRYLNEYMERMKTSYAVAMMDIDNFKRFNDTYGHSTGDKVLKEVALTTAGTIGRRGEVFRYGGEEFIVILPDFNTEDAVKWMEKARQAISGINIAYKKEKLSITVSIGVSCGAGSIDFDRSRNEADMAMYDAKRSGKNRVFRYEAHEDERQDEQEFF